VNQRSYTENDLAEDLVDSNIGISKPEALAMLEATAEHLLKRIKNGDSINLRLLHIHPAILGTYEQGEFPQEAIVRITPSKEVTETAKNIRLRHVEEVRQMYINFVHDTKSNTTNSMITSGGTVKITGHNLKIAGDNPAVGVEFTAMEAPETIYRISARDIISNNPSELIVVAPEMVAGEKVALTVTTQSMHSTKLLKTPRSITFDREFTVVS
jgi:hypothetical protein